MELIGAGGNIAFRLCRAYLLVESTGSGVNTYTYDITGIHITSRNGTVMSYIKDSHGSVIRTADAAGNAMQEAEDRADYDAFGNVYTGSRNTPFGYSGEYVDSESGNVYLRNRYYNSATGRFITEDPAQDGLNWYVYAGNNPVSFVDPSGLSAVPPRDMDWDGDGRVDSGDDRLRFDSNNNRIVDWNENGFIKNKNWYRNRNSNIIPNAKHVYQGPYDLCWAADISMAVWTLTGVYIDFIDIAKDVYGEEDFNKGAGGPVSIARNIIKFGYLDGSGYEVDTNSFNGGDIYNAQQYRGDNPLTFETIVKQIDNGIPFIIKTSSNHVMLLMGYAYDEELNTQYVLCLNSNASSDMPQSMPVYEFSTLKNASAITFKKRDY